jgi:hypothetical protein
MAKITHDIVATLGEYRNREGETKKRYTNVGKAFMDDQGRISLKIDAIPVGPEWSGWLSLYPINKDGQQPRTATRQDQMPPGRQQQRTMPPAPAEAPWENEGEDDIPF